MKHHLSKTDPPSFHEVFDYSGDLSAGSKVLCLWNAQNRIFSFLNKIDRLIGANFGTKMHIQHTKVTDAKLWQYANQISNAHVQYKLFLEEYTAIEFR